MIRANTPVPRLLSPYIHNYNTHGLQNIIRPNSCRLCKRTLLCHPPLCTVTSIRCTATNSIKSYGLKNEDMFLFSCSRPKDLNFFLLRGIFFLQKHKKCAFCTFGKDQFLIFFHQTAIPFRGMITSLWPPKLYFRLLFFVLQ